MVVLVDEQDQELGLMEKIKAHEEGLLHRAFSVFLLKNLSLIKKNIKSFLFVD